MKEDIKICGTCNNDTKLCTCSKEIESKDKPLEANEKPLEEKNIVERHTNKDGQFNLGNCLAEQEAINKHLIEKVEALEQAMQFFVDWYNRTQRVDILVPDHIKDSKIILP